MLPIERIDAEAFARWGEMKGAPLAMCRGFARAIEDEVRAQDTALIQQLVEAIKLDRIDWEDWPDDSRTAFEQIRARLKENHDGISKSP